MDNHEDSAYDAEMIMLMCEMGADGKAYNRERRTQVRKVVSEIYSPPRVTKAAADNPGYGLMPGFAIDLTCNDETDGMP